MLANFLHPCMQPSVRSSCIAADDYAAQNLLAAPQTPAHTAGFSAYSFVRPPVHLDFRLACPIELLAVEVRTRCGSHRVTALDISVRGAAAAGAAFVRIGQAADWRPQADGVRFVNTAFVVRAGDGDDDSIGDSGASGLHRQPFWAQALGRRLAVQHVRVTIRQTHERAVPALRAVRVWGRPAAWCVPEAERRRWQAQWAARVPTFGFYGGGGDGGAEAASASSSGGQSVAATTTATATAADAGTTTAMARTQQPPNAGGGGGGGAAIPDEFLDAITCDLMQLPMTLPSGKCIDRSTLERHQATLACSWGRQPCDPFTGLPFTAERRPLLNAALKAQIDRWLLQHQDRSDVRRAPRTVGTAATAATATAAELAICGRCAGVEQLYTLRGCGHHLCRRCLLLTADGNGGALAERRCARCSRPFARSEAHRVHDKRMV